MKGLFFLLVAGVGIVFYTMFSKRTAQPSAEVTQLQKTIDVLLLQLKQGLPAAQASKAADELVANIQAKVNQAATDPTLQITRKEADTYVAVRADQLEDRYGYSRTRAEDLARTELFPSL